MQPIIVMPLHDPAGLIFPHLIAITPHLKSIFAWAFVSITTSTRETQSEYLTWLEQDDFFQPLYHQAEVQAGDDFLALYTHTVAACSPNQILHLGFPTE